jgi:hypothetical protein
MRTSWVSSGDNNQDFESFSLDYTKYAEYGRFCRLLCMQGSEGEDKPYNYNRSFKSAIVTTAPPDTDKDSLDVYIRSILGVKDPKEKETAP